MEKTTGCLHEHAHALCTLNHIMYAMAKLVNTPYMEDTHRQRYGCHQAERIQDHRQKDNAYQAHHVSTPYSSVSKPCTPGEHQNSW